MPPNPVLQRLVSERTQVNENIDAVLDAANEEERDPTEAERQLISRHRDRLNELEPQIAELLDLEEQRNASRDASAMVRSTPEPSGGALTRTTPAPDEDNPYTHFGQLARDEILVRFDKIAARAGQGARDRAQQRLQRAVAHTLSSDVPGIVAAQHLAQIVDVINAARPVVEVARSVSLSSGTLTYPKITQRPTVGKQGAEKTELPSTAMHVDLEQATAEVFGGAGNLSWQSVAWSNPDALNLWFELAAEAYARATETEACNDLLAALSDAVAVPSDDLAGWMGAIAAAAGEVYENSGRRATHLLTDPTLGYHLLGMVASDAPVFVAAGAGSLQTGAGTIAGLRLVISNGFGASHAVVGDPQSLIAAENPGAPVELRVVEPSIAGFEVGVVGAFAAVVTEPQAFCELTPPAGALTASRGSRSKAKAEE
jgi:hypothetical protein